MSTLSRSQSFRQLSKGRVIQCPLEGISVTGLGSMKYGAPVWVRHAMGTTIQPPKKTRDGYSWGTYLIIYMLK